MNGILVVDKPQGITSAEVVRRVKRAARVKVGHLGTLDPFASGVLPLCLGEGTKIAQFLSRDDKTYEGTIRLGEATDTGDCTGRITRTASVPARLGSDELRSIEQRFTGPYEQVPPMYSALKRSGVPLYKLARQGIEVERASREVHIAALHLARQDDTHLRFEVSCSKGTYVRVLAEDIGVALGSVAHVRTLRRTRFGAFTLAQAIALDAWDPTREGCVIPISQALPHLSAIQIDAAAAVAVRRGQSWELPRLVAGVDRDEALLVDADGEAVAVIVRAAGRWHFARVLAADPD